MEDKKCTMVGSKIWMYEPTHLGTQGGILLKWTWNNGARVLPDSKDSE
jgi:hypothetical protein